MGQGSPQVSYCCDIATLRTPNQVLIDCTVLPSNSLSIKNSLLISIYSMEDALWRYLNNGS